MQYGTIPLPDGAVDVRITWHLPSAAFDALVAEHQPKAVREFPVIGGMARSFDLQDGPQTVVVIGSDRTAKAAATADVSGRVA